MRAVAARFAAAAAPLALASLLAACHRGPPGTLALERTGISVARNSVMLTVVVSRVGGAYPAASVDFATADLTARAGLDYTAVTGTLTWADGESGDRTLTVPIAPRSGNTGGSTFKILLTHATGAALGASDAAIVSIRAPLPLAVGIGGKYLRDGLGNVLQLRGVNVSGLEGYSVQGWAWNGDHSVYNPWGNDRPSWPAILAWHANTVRLPLNEASWLGLTTYDHDGKPRHADPGGNYRAVVTQAVDEATAAGLYVILDLHWNGPDILVPGQTAAVPMTPFEGGSAQNPMADADHSVEFWKSLAATFKGNPGVLFELFNEPFFKWLRSSWLVTGGDEWDAWLKGGTLSHYRNGLNDADPTAYGWQSAGMQQLLDAVRSTGADNVVLVGGVNWAGDLSEWLEHRPADPLNRTAAVWHAYPDPKNPQRPAYGAKQFDYAQRVLDAGIPLVITETGDPNQPGTQGSPFVSIVLPWADQHGASYLGWTWDAWDSGANRLISDASGTPTDGYGRYFKAHLACVASGGLACR